MPKPWFHFLKGEHDLYHEEDIPASYEIQKKMLADYKGEFVVLDGNHWLVVFKEPEFVCKLLHCDGISGQRDRLQQHSKLL